MRYLAASLLFVTSISQAGVQEQIDIEKSQTLLNQTIEQSFLATNHRNFVSSSCLTGALPTTPRTPNYSMNWSYSTDSMSFVLWREPCKDGSGSALLLRATPTAGEPFFCSSSISIVQNGNQNDNIKLLKSSDSYSSVCDDLLVPMTVIVSEYSFESAPFKVDQAMAVYFDFLNRVSVNIPAATVTPVTSQITGSSSGFKSGFVTCKNITTNKSVRNPIAQSGAFDCKASGLSFKSGDKVSVTIQGNVK